MISFDMFVMEDGIPIYMQIIRHIKQGIVAGTISHGDEIPSRRMLSALLGINPNTVQKAYGMLEDERLIESRSGAKSYVVLSCEKIEHIRSQLLENDANAIVGAMKKMGVSKQEAMSLIDRLWEEEQHA